jgi:hypothetical protein
MFNLDLHWLIFLINEVDQVVWRMWGFADAARLRMRRNYSVM